MSLVAIELADPFYDRVPQPRRTALNAWLPRARFCELQKSTFIFAKEPRDDIKPGEYADKCIIAQNPSLIWL
jgi:hypothetical protein